MTNQFKALDDIFECTPNRVCGKVVGLTLSFSIGGWSVDFGRRPGPIFAKRKAWYCNASVNAFHMHRALCRDVADLHWFVMLPRDTKRRVKMLIGLAVAAAYMNNFMYDMQYQTFQVNLGMADGTTPFGRDFVMDVSSMHDGSGSGAEAWEVADHFIDGSKDAARYLSITVADVISLQNLTPEGE